MLLIILLLAGSTVASGQSFWNAKAYADVSTFRGESGAGSTTSYCTDLLGNAADSRLSANLRVGNYSNVIPNTTTTNTDTAKIAAGNSSTIIKNDNKVTAAIANSNKGDIDSLAGGQNYVSMQIRSFGSSSNKTLMPATYFISITAKNTNQTILFGYFSTPTGILHFKMEPSGQGENKSQESFVPNKLIPSFLLRLTDENGNILVRNSTLFEKGQAYVADISLAGIEQSFFCSSEHLSHAELTWTVRDDDSVEVVAP